jgi:hypothetical protein
MSHSSGNLSRETGRAKAGGCPARRPGERARDTVRRPHARLSEAYPPDEFLKLRRISRVSRHCSSRQHMLNPCGAFLAGWRIDERGNAWLNALNKESMGWMPVWARSVVDPLQRLSTRPALPVYAYLDII